MSQYNFIKRNNIGLKFPFKDSEDGIMYELTNSNLEAIKSHLIHLLMTQKKQRYYQPDFGIDLLKYVFEPVDDTTINQIKEEITTTVLNKLFNVSIDNIDINTDTDTKNIINIRIDFSINDGYLKENDFIDLTF